MNKRILAIVLIFSCLFSLGCNTKAPSNTEVKEENVTDISNFNIVEEADNIQPEDYAEYISKCAKYYSDYIDVGDYINITYSIRRNASDTDDSYADRKFNAIYEIISDNSNVKLYPKDIYDYLISTFSNNMNEEYEQYKEDNMSFINYVNKEHKHNFKTIDEYDEWVENYVQSYLKQMMIIYIIAYENGITVSVDAIKEEGEELASYYGYNDYQEILDTYGNEMNAEIGYQVLYQNVEEFLISIATNE